MQSILVQPGPINVAPRDRKPDPLILTPETYEVDSQTYSRSPNDRRTNSSFRLISFGRSLPGVEGEDYPNSRAAEQVDVQKVFGV